MNPYLPIPSVIEDVITETPAIKTFIIRPAEPIAFEAGQFVELSVPGLGEAPFTPSSSPAVTDRMEITIMRVGHLTDHLHRLGPGATVGLRGPLGVGYPIDELRGHEVVVVGGGCGVGPLRALLFAMFEEIESFPRIILRYGAHSPNDIVFRDQTSARWRQGANVDVMVSVDEGDPDWRGPVGVVTTILDEEHLKCDLKNARAVMCGPPMMMKYGCELLVARGVLPANIYVSLELNMSCGIGKCGHCRLGPYYVCTDGPVFPLDRVQMLEEAWA